MDEAYEEHPKKKGRKTSERKNKFEDDYCWEN